MLFVIRGFLEKEKIRSAFSLQNRKIFQIRIYICMILCYTVHMSFYTIRKLLKIDLAVLRCLNTDKTQISKPQIASNPLFRRALPATSSFQFGGTHREMSYLRIYGKPRR